MMKIDLQVFSARMRTSLSVIYVFRKANYLNYVDASMNDSVYF